jgi:hypothetical protein
VYPNLLRYMHNPPVLPYQLNRQQPSFVTNRHFGTCYKKTVRRVCKPSSCDPLPPPSREGEGERERETKRRQ